MRTTAESTRGGGRNAPEPTSKSFVIAKRYWSITDSRPYSDVSVDRKRLEARKVLRDRRADEAYQEWLRQLRDRAYVELRLEER
jgi:hypothetical protein